MTDVVLDSLRLRLLPSRRWPNAISPRGRSRRRGSSPSSSGWILGYQAGVVTVEALLIKRRKPGLMHRKGRGVKSQSAMTIKSDLPGECRHPDPKALGLMGSVLSSRNPPERFSIWAPAFAGEIGLEEGSGHAQIVALADLDAVVAQDRIGRGQVEEEVRLSLTLEIGQALDHASLAATGQGDVAIFGAGEGCWVQTLDIGDGPVDAGDQFSEAGFDIVPGRNLFAGQRAQQPLAKSVAICTWRISGNMSG